MGPPSQEPDHPLQAFLPVASPRVLGRSFLMNLSLNPFLTITYLSSLTKRKRAKIILRSLSLLVRPDPLQNGHRERERVPWKGVGSYSASILGRGVPARRRERRLQVWILQFIAAFVTTDKALTKIIVSVCLSTSFFALKGYACPSFQWSVLCSATRATL